KDGRVPGSIYKVLLRGLKTDPEERWPSMEALLEPLQAAVAPRRRRFVAPVVVVVGLLGVGAGLAANRWASRCSGAQRQLEGVWDDARREEARAAILASGKTFAASTWSRVEPQLDEYAQAWVRDHTDACEATAVRHEQSEEHLGLRMSCLRQRQQHLRATVDELTTADPEVVEHAVQAVSSLPALSRCADIEALTAEVPPPEDPAVAQRVAELDEQLVQARAKQQAGEYDEALTLTRAVATEADALGYEPLIARGRLLHSQLQHDTADYEGALLSLEAAYETALANRMPSEAASASAMLVALLGSPLSRHEQARRWAAHAEPLSRAAATDEARTEYLESVGILARDEGKLDEARDSLEQALAIQQRSLGPDHPEVGRTLQGLGTVAKDQGELVQAYGYHAQALAIFEQAFGPDHPMTAACLQSLGTVKYQEGALEQARELYERGLAIAQDALGPDHPQVGNLLVNLGNVAQLQGDFDEARRAFERALAVETKALGPEAVQVAYSLNNLGLLAYRQDELPAARDFHERALAILEDQLGPDHQHVAYPLTGLGNVAKAQGKLQEAVDFQSRAAAIFEKALGPDHPNLAHPLTGLGNLLLTQQQPARAIEPLERALAIRTTRGIDPAVTAETRYHLARALWDAPAAEGRDRARAHRLAVEARDVWAAHGSGREVYLERAETWLAEHAEPKGDAGGP
ncbi:MAG: tetratricopeptide repeat protein, partial [Nannocystaceae bacterium]